MGDVTWTAWRAEEFERIFRAAAMEGLSQAAEAVLAEAQERAPVETGTLRRSGTVTDAPHEMAVYVSFNTPYALRQHEELRYQHPNGGEAKYLENALTDKAPQIPGYVKRRVLERLRRDA